MAWFHIALGLLLLVGACARPPAPLAVSPLAEVTVEQARQHDAGGQRVRWGGTIAAVTPRRDETCLEVVSRPLDDQARPRRTDQTDGRFIACAPGFYDPAIHTQGREVTVVGTVQSPTEGTIGEYAYRYARLAAERVYLWPERETQRVVYYGPWVEPLWYPYWGPWPYYPWPYRW
jgi:outer membrane lipoprotein